MGKTETLIPIILFNVFFILFIVGIIIFIREYKLKKKEYNAKLQSQQEEHKRELLSAQIEIQNQTMHHIGREIHDNVGQKLTLASLYTQQLSYENKAPNITQNIENISSIINESLAELRALSKSLTDNRINSLTLNELIADECEKINKTKKCTVCFKTNAKEFELKYDHKTVLYRILQEFIQNSLKHSNCKNITIEMLKTNSKIIFTLKDDGKGFDINHDKKNGIGLRNMKKRAKIIDAEFDLTSSDSGTQITLTIDYNE